MSHLWRWCCYAVTINSDHGRQSFRLALLCRWSSLRGGQLTRFYCNMERHKISDEFGQIRLLTGITCPLVQKKPIFDLVQSIACLVLIETLWNLKITWTGIKSLMCSYSGKIRLFTLELLALECQNKPSLTVRSVACVIFIQSL